ncbi:MAG: hypothetical protein PHE83_01455 [Opitutaceae bacterium]|nr:hypothetical protein [Opitutaceae bacterium]
MSPRAPGLGWLFVGRVIAGLTAGVLATANACIADVTPPEKRAQSFGAGVALRTPLHLPGVAFFESAMLFLVVLELTLRVFRLDAAAGRTV